MSCWCCDNNQIDPHTCWCNIVGVANTTVVTDNNNITVSSPFYQILSPDNSIEVHASNMGANTIVYEISSTCQEDKYVIACASDNSPWTIWDKVRVDTSWPLTRDLHNCPWNAYYEIWFDPSQLNTPDEKVKWKASCNEVYGKDLFTAWNWLQIVDTWCHGSIRLTNSPFIRPHAQALLETDVTIIYPHWGNNALPNKWWFCISANGRGMWPIGSNDFEINSALFAWTPTAWYSDGSWDMQIRTCHKTWFYHVWMNASFGVNRWVEAARVALISNINGRELLLNVWYANSDEQTLADNEISEDGDNEDLIVWNWWGQSQIVYIEEWNTIRWLFWRVSNNKQWWPWPVDADWRMVVYASSYWFTPNSPQNDTIGCPWQWTNRWVVWVSDANWDSRYL